MIRMSLYENYDKSSGILRIRWVENNGWNHDEIWELPKGYTLQEFIDDFSDWTGDIALHKDLEAELEALCLGNPLYRDTMLEEIRDYDARGHVTWRYDDVMSCQLGDIMDPVLPAVFGASPGETISVRELPMTFTRVR